MEDVNITVVTYNRLNLTQTCLTSLLNLTRGAFKVHVVDNGSSDGTREYLQSIHDPRLKVILLGRNMGVSVAANVGWAAYEDAPLYVKLDNDVEILSPDWLDILIKYSENQDLGMIGYLFLAKHTVREITLQDGSPFWDFSSCGGACCAISYRVHQQLGFWTEDYGHYGFEDMEYGQRCRLLHLGTGYVPYTDKVTHLGYNDMLASYEEKKQSGLEDITGKKMYFFNKLLFEHGIRPLKVARRYLPTLDTYPVRFKLNPEYRPILALLNEMQRTVPYKRENDLVSLDLSRWKITNK